MDNLLTPPNKGKADGTSSGLPDILTLEDLDRLENEGWKRHYGKRFNIGFGKKSNERLYKKISGDAEARLYVGRYVDGCLFELSFL